jgi:hypothetical protein
MGIHSMAEKRRAARQQGAAGRCEWPGLSCDVPTHIREVTPDYRIMTKRSCTASEPSVVVLFDLALDPLNDDNLRALCQRCAESHERTMSGSKS